MAVSISDTHRPETHRHPLTLLSKWDKQMRLGWRQHSGRRIGWRRGWRQHSGRRIGWRRGWRWRWTSLEGIDAGGEDLREVRTPPSAKSTTLLTEGVETIAGILALHGDEADGALKVDRVHGLVAYRQRRFSRLEVFETDVTRLAGLVLVFLKNLVVLISDSLLDYLRDTLLQPSYPTRASMPA